MKKYYIHTICIIMFINFSCSNNSQQMQSLAVKEDKASVVKEKLSPQYLRYKARFDSLSEQPNFHVDSTDNFLSLEKAENSEQKLKFSTALQHTIIKASKDVSSTTADIDDIQVCKDGIDWIFCCGGDNPPTRLSGYFYPVKYFGYSLIRGAYSARTCGNLAVVHAVFGLKDDALTWIQAAQAHNPEVVAAFARNSDYALNYAVSQHAASAFAELGIPYLDYAKSGIHILKNMAENYHPDPTPPDEKNRSSIDELPRDMPHGGKN